MGFQEWENKKKEADEKLKEYLNHNFPQFKQSFIEKVGEWTRSKKVAEIINNVDIHMVLFIKVEGEEEIVKGKVKRKGYAIWRDKCKEIEIQYSNKDGDNGPKEAVRNEIIKIFPNGYWEIELGESKIVQNTKMGFSDILQGPFDVIWIMSFEEGEVYRFVANVVLDILGKIIDNLNKIKRVDEGEIRSMIQVAYGSLKFMDIYSLKLREKYTMLPEAEMITKVLFERYEKRENNAKMYFMDIEEFEKFKLKISFDKSCYIKEGFNKEENIAGLRKLLEICANSERCLAVSEKNKEVIGILTEKEILKMSKKYVSIHFNETGWKICKDDKMLLRYKNGKLYIDSKDEEETLQEKCKEARLEADAFGKIFGMLEDKAAHGALIIVAEDAKDEVVRLCEIYGRGIKIDSLQIKEEDEYQMLLGMANVDGAIFLDYEGYCYGFGVILDGIAKIEGDPARGARYNSAVNYIANTPEVIKRCAFIRSEDKEKAAEVVSSESIKIKCKKYER